MQMCCPNSTFETAKSMEAPVVGTRAKRKAPARFQPKGWRIVAADRCPNSAFETAKSIMEVPVVGKHAKRQSPSRISARRLAKAAADRRGAQTAPSKPPKAWRYRWWARMRNGRAPWIPAGRQVPKQHLRNRSKHGGTGGGHTCETAADEVPKQHLRNR